LLEQASLTINPGERLAVIGANGTGKTSLFKVLQGDLTLDQGDCLMPNQWRLSYMEQEVTAVHRSAVEFVLDGDQQLRKLEQQLEQAQSRNDDHAVAEQLGALDTYQAFNKRYQA